MRICILLLLTIAVVMPVNAMKLIPGSYALEWRIPAPHEDQEWNRVAIVDLKPMTPEDMEKFEGIVSSKPYWSATHNYTFIIDESKGTGTRYDIAYVIFNPAESTINVKDHLIVSLPKLRKDDSDARVTAVSFKHKDKLVIDIGDGQKTAVDLTVQFAVDETGNKTPMLVDFGLRGGWYGKIDTDMGPADIRVVDRNGNGTYGDKVTASGPGDTVAILKDRPNYPIPVYLPCNVLNLGKAVLYGGKLYSVSVTPTGDLLNIAPYSGETGTVKLAVVDGSKKPVKWFQVEASNRLMKTCYPPGVNQLTLPKGDYSLNVTIWPKPYAPDDEDFFGIVFEPNRIVKAKTKTKEITVGGPIKMEIEPGFDCVRARASEEKYIEVAFSMRNGQLNGILGGRSVAVNIRDSKGNMVSSGHAVVAWGGSCGYLLKAPNSPGAYKICATFDPRPYQSPIFAYKALFVY